MATHSSVLAWRIPGTGEPGRLMSMGSHRVGHDWSDLAAAAAAAKYSIVNRFLPYSQIIMYSPGRWWIPTSFELYCPSFLPLKWWWWFLWPSQVAFVPTYPSTDKSRARSLPDSLYNCTYFFIFGCIGSSLLRELLPNCGEHPSHCSGLSCRGARALGHRGLRSRGLRAQQLQLLALEHKLNSCGAGT